MDSFFFYFQSNEKITIIAGNLLEITGDQTGGAKLKLNGVPRANGKDLLYHVVLLSSEMIPSSLKWLSVFSLLLLF